MNHIFLKSNDEYDFYLSEKFFTVKILNINNLNISNPGRIKL